MPLLPLLCCCAEHNQLDASSSSAVVTILGDLIPLTQPPMCKSSPHVAGGIALPDSEDSYGIMLPQDLPDVRTYHQGLPQNLDQEAYMKAEGATYYW